MRYQHAEDIFPLGMSASEPISKYSNIYYEVCSRTNESLKCDMAPLVENLKKKCIKAECVIVYCCTVKLCADL